MSDPTNDTGPLPAIAPGSAWPSSARETTVDELFRGVGPAAIVGTGAGVATGGGAPGAAVAEVPAFEPSPSVSSTEHPDGLASDPAVAGAARSAGRQERLRVVPDTSSPRVPLGLLWFVLGSTALAFGPVPAAVVFAPVGVVGAIQTATALRRDGARPRPLLSGAVALGVILAALAPTSRSLGIAVLVGVAASLAGGFGRRRFDLTVATSSVRSWLGAALAAAVPVALAGYEPSLAVLVFFLACAYDAGDYLVGSASASWFEGPAAGALGLLAVGFGAAVLRPGALSDHPLWPAVLIAAVACPLGQLLASLALPDARAFAPGLRRLDSLVAVGVAWLVLFG